MSIMIGQKTIIQDVNVGIIGILLENLDSDSNKRITILYFVGESANNGIQKNIVLEGIDADNLYTNWNSGKDVFDLIFKKEGFDYIITPIIADSEFLNVKPINNAEVKI